MSQSQRECWAFSASVVYGLRLRNLSALFLCGAKDGDDNEYVTMGTKHVHAIYFNFLGNKIVTFQISVGMKLRIFF
jgi:hypothetical protein